MAAKTTKESIAEAVNWYSGKRPVYEQLSKKVESIIQEIIIDQGIPFHAIYSRAKEIDSFAKKIENPKYIEPTSQITDLAGIRIITYVESDLDKICKVLEAHFEIDTPNSIDKSQMLGVDKVGYRSIHYIAKLPSDRVKLPEYKKFTGLYFEIQIRTILQHAWAEIEHDKNYKFTGELPANLKRRFKVLAGVLELADREFNGIAYEIDKYSESVNADTKNGNLEIMIDSTSLKAFLQVKFENLINIGLEPNFYKDEYEKELLSELRRFGIFTLKQLDEIIPEDFSDRLISFGELASDNQNYAGIIRNLMMISDCEKYFKESWQNNWNGLSENSVKFISSYGSPLEEQLIIHDIIIN